jgi:hypothetical protein
VLLASRECSPCERGRWNRSDESFKQIIIKSYILDRLKIPDGLDNLMGRYHEL